MECGLCGTLNRDLARFCGGCGAPMGRVCPTCKSEIDAGLRFCDQCGTEVDERVAPQPASVAAGDRVVRAPAAVLVADLLGSAALAARADHEIARQVVDRYHAVFRQVVAAYGGTAERRSADSMASSFGVTEPAGDAAQRAQLARSEIEERFARLAADLDERYGGSLTVRFDLETGEVAGEPAHGEDLGVTAFRDDGSDPVAGDAAVAFWSLVDRREVAVLDRILASAVTFADHLPNGLPPVQSARQLVNVLRRLFELAPDTRFVAGPPVVAGPAARLDVEQRSTAPSGTEYRWDRVVVMRCADDGRIDAIECFAADARADAEARFEEWSTPA